MQIMSLANNKQQVLVEEAAELFTIVFGDDFSDLFSVEGKGNHRIYFHMKECETVELTANEANIILDELQTAAQNGDTYMTKKSALDFLNTALPDGPTRFGVGSESGEGGESGEVEVEVEVQGMVLEGTPSSEAVTGEEIMTEKNVNQEVEEVELEDEFEVEGFEAEDFEMDSEDEVSLEDTRLGEDAEGDFDTDDEREYNPDDGDFPEDFESDGPATNKKEKKSKEQKAAEAQAKEEEKAAKAAAREAEKVAKAEARKAEKEAAAILKAEQEEQEEEKQKEVENSIRSQVREVMVEYGRAQQMGGASQFYEGRELTRLERLTGAAGLKPSHAVRVQQEEYDALFGLLANGETKFPNKGSRTNKRAAYRAWVEEAELEIEQVITHFDYVNPVTGQEQPMSLATARAFASLIALNEKVTKDNAPRLLAFAHRYPYPVIAKVARFMQVDENIDSLLEEWKGKTNEEIIAWAEMMAGREDGAKPEPTHKSIRIQTALYTAFMESTVPYVASVIVEALGDRPDISDEVEGLGASVTEVFEVVRQLVEHVDPDWLRMMVKKIYGQITEDEMTDWQGMSDKNVISLDSFNFTDEGEVVEQAEAEGQEVEDVEEGFEDADGEAFEMDDEAS